MPIGLGVSLGVGGGKPATSGGAPAPSGAPFANEWSMVQQSAGGASPGDHLYLPSDSLVYWPRGTSETPLGFTLSFWVKFADCANNRYILYAGGNVNNATGIDTNNKALQLISYGGQIRAATSPSPWAIFSSSGEFTTDGSAIHDFTTDYGTWHHLAITADYNGSTFYLDGEGNSGSGMTMDCGSALNDQTGGNDKRNGGGMVVGGHRAGDYAPVANFDEVAMWPEVLSAENIATIANAGAAAGEKSKVDLNAFGSNPGPLIWYRMGDSAGGTTPVNNAVIAEITNAGYGSSDFKLIQDVGADQPFFDEGDVA